MGDPIPRSCDNDWLGRGRGYSSKSEPTDPSDAGIILQRKWSYIIETLKWSNPSGDLTYPILSCSFCRISLIITDSSWRIWSIGSVILLTHWSSIDCDLVWFYLILQDIWPCSKACCPGVLYDLWMILCTQRMIMTLILCELENDLTRRVILSPLLANSGT